MSTTKKLALLSKYGSSGSGSLGTTIQHDYDNDRETEKKDKKKKKKKSSKKNNTTRKVAGDKERGTAMTLVKDMDEMDPVATVDDADNSGDDNFDGTEENVEGDGPTLVEMNCDMPPPENEVLENSGQRAHHSDRETNNNSQSKRRRRKRHDSEKDEPRCRHDSNYDDDSRSERRRRRHDSDDDDDDDEYRSKRRSRRHDSDDDNGDEIESRSKERRGRRQRSNDNDSRSRGNRRRRHDSDSSSSSPSGQRNYRSNIRRHDSDEGSSISSSGHRLWRKRAKAKKIKRDHGSDTSSSTDEGKNGTHSMKMSSGHSAGLQSTSQFQKAEASLERKRQREAKIISEQNSGDRSSVTTVYRDKHGRKITEQNELSRHRQKDNKKGRINIEIDEKEQLEWGKGRAQIQAEEEAIRERSIVQNESFARFENDERLEQERKELIRKEDPMALQAYKRQMELKACRGEDRRTKHTYKGPEPKPNRFGIVPGYRWDGVDRGNGFEDKVLAFKYSKSRKKEDAYRWSAADM